MTVSDLAVSRAPPHYAELRLWTICQNLFSYSTIQIYQQEELHGSWSQKKWSHCSQQAMCIKHSGFISHCGLPERSITPSALYNHMCLFRLSSELDSSTPILVFWQWSAHLKPFEPAFLTFGAGNFPDSLNSSYCCVSP